MGEYMKKFLLLSLIGIFLASAFAIDAQAAKKSSSKKSKISKEFLDETDAEITRLTTKIYGRALLSPQDNESLITIKIKLDNQMVQDSSATELAPLYFKTGNILKMRDMNKDAIECYQTVLENFNNTAFAPKARAALIDMGVDVKDPQNENTEDAADKIQ